MRRFQGSKGCQCFRGAGALCFGLLIVLAVAGCASVAQERKVADAGKNVYDVKFGRVAAVPTDEWNFNFRPYGKSSGLLVSDPAIQRNVAAGNATEKDATALHVSCDEDGFTVRILCTEKDLKTYMATTNDFPSPAIEMYVMPGDTDDEAIGAHYMTAGTMSEMNEYPDKTNDRFYRQVRPFMTCTQELYGDAALLLTIRYDWLAFFDQLPVSRDKRDNFWRLSVIRWTEGGQTWGGTVHKMSLAGYIRWPAFTEAQRDAILKTTLRKAWTRFNAEGQKPDLAHDRFPNPPTDWNLGWVTNEFATVGRTAPNYQEDLAFRKTLVALDAKGLAYAGEISRFDTLDAAAKAKLYHEACEYLFNFRYRVGDEYRKCEENLIFERN